MFEKCVLTVAVLVGWGGFGRADTFLATITKVEDGKVTYLRATYHAGTAGADKYTFEKAETVEVTRGVTVTRGHFLPVAGDTATTGRLTGKTTPLKGGLNDVLVRNIAAGKSTRPSLVTVADDGDDKGKVTAINFWSSGSPK